MKKFESQVSLMAKKTEKEIWNIWKNTTDWVKWDDSKKVEINGEFVVGSIISCYSSEEPEPRNMEIIELVENKEFVDKTTLPFGNIKTYHTLKLIDGNVQVTHKMIAEINDDMANMFGNEVWPNIQSSIFLSLNKLINL